MKILLDLSACHWVARRLYSSDSMTCWIIEKSEGFTSVGLHRISESVRAYAYLILSSQAFEIC